MSGRKELETNYIIFLGTGGARVVVFKQILASGGLWLSRKLLRGRKLGKRALKKPINRQALRGLRI